jgi:hypothetical protein
MAGMGPVAITAAMIERELVDDDDDDGEDVSILEIDLRLR